MIAILIQARVGSTRLPRKVLMDLNGDTMLGQIIKRCRQSKKADLVVVVTSDEEVVEIARQQKVPYSLYKADGRDVLAEFYQAAKAYGVDTIVRITADCPCVMPRMIDKMITAYSELQPDILVNRNDNLKNCEEIDGLDIEIFGFKTLERAYKEATLPEDREHVTKWMLDNSWWGQYEGGWHIDTDQELKLSVDTQEDLNRVRQIYSVLGSDFDMRDLVKYLEKDNVAVCEKENDEI